jgi:hypothetical protein
LLTNDVSATMDVLRLISDLLAAMVVLVRWVAEKEETLQNLSRAFAVRIKFPWCNIYTYIFDMNTSNHLKMVYTSIDIMTSHQI